MKQNEMKVTHDAFLTIKLILIYGMKSINHRIIGRKDVDCFIFKENKYLSTNRCIWDNSA